jgi:hypothetical protein
VTPERLAQLRAELEAAGFVVNSRQFWEAAAEAIRFKEGHDRADKEKEARVARSS